jgi:hypothetical protein
MLRLVVQAATRTVMQPTWLCSVLLMSAAVQAAGPAVFVTQDPLVMRMSKDEFRIAFGINAGHCGASGCHGVIRYRVSWRAEDGTTGSDVKQVAYAVAPRAPRSIVVDRQYFDTAEAEHTTEITHVSIDRITCRLGAPARPLQVTSAPERT